MRKSLLWMGCVALALACDDDGGEQVVEPDMMVEADAMPDVGSARFDGCTPSPEVCNEVDDDCDGRIDADDPDLQLELLDDPNNCGACGTVCEAPRAELTCQAGECILVRCDPGFRDFNADLSDGCEGDCVVTAGGRDVCDEIDNDCDGEVDEEVDLANDLANCGACGNVCPAPANGIAVCAEGACGLAECNRDFYDLDGDEANGCEYACARTSTDRVAEFCNGLDDDCDGRMDEAADLAPPEDTCGELGACGLDCEDDAGCGEGQVCSGGICAPAEVPELACETDADCQATHAGLACLAHTVLGDDLAPVTERRCVARVHRPMCDGAEGYRCVRSPKWRFGDELTRCDDVDNDCDGRVDEDFVAALFLEDRETVRPCRVGLGVCANEGVTVCAADGDGTTCSVEPGAPNAEADDDCNGLDDDCDGVIDDDFEDAVVRVGDVEVYAHEASRPGATAELAGLDPVPDDEIAVFVEDRACSRPGVLPWAGVTWDEAEAACAAAGARLCEQDEWVAACAGADDAYPYGAAFEPNTCNGGPYDSDPQTEGDQDAVVLTGERAQCVRDGVFDLSGNLKEWTAERREGLRVVRGGSYESNLPGGLTCQQDGDLKARDFRHPTLGFRCCRDL